MAAATVKVLQHNHGECREVLKIQAYKHEKSAATTFISITVIMDIFKLIFDV